VNNEVSGLFVPSVIDFVVLVTILLNGYMGFRRGLSGEVAHFVVLVVGAALTVYLLRPVGSLCFRYATPLIPETGRLAFAFVATTIVAATVMLVAYRPLYHIFDRGAPKHRYKAGGAVAGLMYGLVGVAFVLVLLNLWPSATVNRVVGDSSATGKMAGRIVPAVKRMVSSQGRNPGRTEVPGARVINTLRREKREHAGITK
jgi:uncharacterized membrane protein required for colicin V production